MRSCDTFATVNLHQTIMTPEPTQQQTSEDQQRARQLSLKRTTPPAKVPGYEIQSLLGCGAYGEVWVGVDQNTGRRVAIKFYTRGSSVDFSLLSREVEKLVYLSADRYVVQLLDVGWDADPPYYVMDHIENGSLEDELGRRGTYPVGEAIDLFQEVAVGLMHLHGKGILHCDLKPGNVLLDQDHKPRLADFGQSRLSHEQVPALGTLFFMAPEQADLESVPDSRWDVFALGALLYCMLTGSPPYRSDEIISQVESATDIGDRLARYRDAIQAAPPPVGHRQIRGVDRALAEIIDRCIAVDPHKRFESIQSVLLALKQREENRARRPVMLLGLIGPLILLTVMAIFGMSVYSRTVNESDDNLTRKARESNGWAAQFAARSAAEQINDYFQSVEQLAESVDFRTAFFQAIQDEQLEGLRSQLQDPHRNRSAELNDQRDQFVNHAARQPIQVFLESLMQRPDHLEAASWFVCDQRGTQLAAVFSDQPTNRTIGLNYSYRTYFHGGRQDRVSGGPDTEQKRYQVAPADQPRDHIHGSHLSAIFRSQATNTWKIAFSTPVRHEGQFVGILAVTVEMGNFVDFTESDKQYAMLVDGREGPNKGVILEHPLFDKLPKPLPKRFSQLRVGLSQLDSDTSRFQDPAGQDPLGEKYDRQWIAAKRPVLRRLSKPDAGSETKYAETGLVVLALEDAASVVEPAHQLGSQLLRLAMWALVVVIGVTLLMWYLVIRTLQESRDRVGRAFSATSEVTSIHNVKTLALPRSPPKTTRRD